MNQKHDTRLEIEGDALRCRNANDVIVWATPISQIVLIAEYTTDEGPYVDDYFLNFWSCEGGQLLRSSATLYAGGRDEVMTILSERLGAKLELGLCGSTEWRSRVMWPRELADRPYFTFREAQPESWLQRVKRFALGPTLEYWPSDEVKAFLRRYERPSA